MSDSGQCFGEMSDNVNGQCLEKKQRRGGGQEVLERGQGHPVLNSLARKDLKDKRVYAQDFLSKKNNK